MLKSTITSIALFAASSAAFASNDCNYVRDYKNDSRHTANIQKIIGVTADGISGPRTRGAIAAFLNGCGYQQTATVTPTIDYAALEQARLEAERQRLEAERRALEAAKLEAERQRLRNKRGLLTPREYRTLHGDSNGEVKGYRKAVAKIKELGYRNPTLIDNGGHTRVRKMHIQHTYTFQGRQGTVKIRVTRHLFGSWKGTTVLMDRRAGEIVGKKKQR